LFSTIYIIHAISNLKNAS